MSSDRGMDWRSGGSEPKLELIHNSTWLTFTGFASGNAFTQARANVSHSRVCSVVFGISSVTVAAKLYVNGGVEVYL